MAEENAAAKVSRKDQLVQVALTVLERDGFAHMSIGEVARLAGIKPPSLYKQFASKDDIEVSLIGHGHEVLADDLDAAFASVPDGVDYRERVTIMVRCLREFAHRHPQLYLLMNSRPFPEAALGLELQQRTGAHFLELVPDRVFATSVWAWAHGILSLELVGRLPHLDEPDAPWHTLIDTIVARSDLTVDR